MNMNTNIDFRDEIIFNGYEEDEYSGGIRRFLALTQSKVNMLVENHFINLDEKQDKGPSAKELIDFLNNHSNKFCLGGFAISNDRSDYNVVFDSIQSIVSTDKLTAEDIMDFKYLCRNCDDFSSEPILYGWWD